MTKTFGFDVVRAAVAAGLGALGENYLRELEDKRSATRDLTARWHYLGALQGNKIARVSAVADVIEGVSRDKELVRLAALGCRSALYVEVDVTGDAARSGAPATEVPALVTRGRELGLDVRGLMTVAPPDPSGARVAFATVRDLADTLGLPERSMGMSDDFELACDFGTTEVRLGRALFGDRVPRRGASPNIVGLDGGDEESA